MTYTYNAKVDRVIDGDTVVLAIDLGFDIWIYQHVRLLGLNAREHDQPGGPEAASHLATMLYAGLQVQVCTLKPDKYGGRYDAAIKLADGRDLSTILIQDQWAAAWSGAGIKPVPPWPRTVA